MYLQAEGLIKFINRPTLSLSHGPELGPFHSGGIYTHLPQVFGVFHAGAEYRGALLPACSKSESELLRKVRGVEGLLKDPIWFSW